MTQEQFARRIGTTKAIIENVEMGRTNLSEELAARISAIIGVVPSSLYGTQEPQSFTGEPLSARTREQWMTFGYSDEDALDMIKLSVRLVGVLLHTSLRNPKNENLTRPFLFREVVMQINQFVFDAIGRHGLAEQAKDYVQEREARSRHETTTVGALRVILGRNDEWQTHDDAGWSDDLQADVIETSNLVFEPFVGFEELNGVPYYRDLWKRFRTIFQITIGEETFSVTHYKFTLRVIGRPAESFNLEDLEGIKSTHEQPAAPKPKLADSPDIADHPVTRPKARRAKTSGQPTVRKHSARDANISRRPRGQ